jgi:hypothetical protein
MTAPPVRDHGCRLCALVPKSEHRFVPVEDPTIFDAAGEDLIALLRPDRHEVLVAPSRHVAGLSALSGRSLAKVLAALRRVALVIQLKGEGVAIERADEFRGAEGHVCIRVLMDPSAGTTTRFDDPVDLAHQLREALIPPRSR